MESDDEAPPIFSGKSVKKKSKKHLHLSKSAQEERQISAEEVLNSFLEERVPGDDEGDPASFADLGLAPWIQKTCGELGMVKPTPIQRRCIPQVMS
jgi:hypothetical protein